MLFLHAVLAAVYSGFIVSALPGPGNVRDVLEDAELTGVDDPSNHVQYDATTDDAWEWTPDAHQLIMDTHPTYAEDFDVQDPIIHFPDRPQHFPPGAPWPPKKAPPPHPHPTPGKPKHDTGNKTIYQVLETHPRFSRLFKLVNYTEDVTKYLNDSSVSVSFFALPNWGFPKRPKKSGSFNNEDVFSVGGNLVDMLAIAEGLINSHDKPDEEKLKKFLKYVLLYNILPEKLPAQELAKNNTFGTSLALPDGSLDGKHLRVRVAQGFGLSRRPTVNFYSKIIIPDIPAANGVIHVVTKPVLPPPSVFQIAFLFPDAFSTLTSAIQRVGLADAVDWRDVKDSSPQGEPAVTVFAPGNKAFSHLPPKLKLFLFSPFGERALKKILQFHIVPNHVLHSDYLHEVSHFDSVAAHYESGASQFYAHIDYRGHDLSGMFEEPTQWVQPPLAAPFNVDFEKWMVDMPVRKTPSCATKEHHLDGHLRPVIECIGPSPGISHHDAPHFGGPNVPRPCDGSHHPHRRQQSHLVFSVNITVPTLLKDHPLDVHVAQVAFNIGLGHTYYKNAVFAHGHRVFLPDVPARNGAVHVIDKLLNPLRKSHDGHQHQENGEFNLGPDEMRQAQEDEWAGWEEWLPRWADEE